MKKSLSISMNSDHNFQELAKRVLEQGYLISLGIVDEQGPWVADVIYAFDDDFNIYWMSTSDRRHSIAIAANSNVAGAITVTTGSGISDFGIQLSGVAEELEAVPRDVVLRYFQKGNKPEPAVDFVVFEDHQWYVLRPTRIELIDQEHFGYDRQRVR